MTSQARARAAGAFLLPLIIALLRALPATGGACWSKVNSLGRCKEILSQGVTREQCCSGAIGGPKSSPRASGLWTSGPRSSSVMSPASSSSSSSSALTSVSSSVRVEEVGLRSESGSDVIGGVGPETTAYSEEDYDNGALFFWQVLGGGVKCDSCRASCEGVRCAEGRRCVLRRGMPRCVCKAECRPGRPPEPEGPVCGSDGRTYRSLCELKRRACRKQAGSANELGLAYAGQCRSSCAGVRCRHGRSCLLDQNLSAHCVKCSRRCSLKPSDEKQLLALKPVCGVDGNTYKSACHLRAAACRAGRAIAIAYRGPCNRKHKDCKSIECRPGQRCLAEPNSGRPRCVTCLYRCPRGKQLVRRERGRQRAYQDGTPLALCASNNLTYPSWCHIMKDACITGIVLETRHAGPCNARDPPAFHNDDEADSINGNDGGRSNSGPRKKASAKNLQRAMKKAGAKSLKNNRAPFVL